MTAPLPAKVGPFLFLHASIAKDVMSPNPWSIREEAAVHGFAIGANDRSRLVHECLLSSMGTPKSLRHSTPHPGQNAKRIPY